MLASNLSTVMTKVETVASLVSTTTVINNNDIIESCSSASSPHDHRHQKMSHVPCSMFIKDDRRLSSSSSMVIDDTIKKLINSTSSPPTNDANNHRISETNGSSSSQQQPFLFKPNNPMFGRVNSGVGGRNKRKNFQPRCITDDTTTTTSTTISQESTKTTSSSFHSKEESSSGHIGKDDITSSNINNNNNNMKSIEDLLFSNSSLTNSLLTQLITDLNSQHQQQPMISAQSQTVNQQVNEKQPLDLSNQEKMILMSQRNNQNSTQTNQLLEMFLLRNARNQLSTTTSTTTTSPLSVKNVQSKIESTAKIPKVVPTTFDNNNVKTKMNQQQRKTPQQSSFATQQSFQSQLMAKTGCKTKKTSTTTTDINIDSVVASKQHLQSSTIPPTASSFPTSNSNNNFLEFLQFYNFNRENYLKFLQQTQPTTTTVQQQLQSTKDSKLFKNSDDNINGNDRSGNHDDHQNDGDDLDDDDDDNMNKLHHKNSNFGDEDSDDDEDEDDGGIEDRLSVGQQHNRSISDLFKHSKVQNNPKDNGSRRKTFPTNDKLFSDNNEVVVSENNFKEFDIEKLKQLQQLYKLNALQQHEMDGSLLPTISKNLKNPFESLMFNTPQQNYSIEKSLNKLSNSSSLDNNINDNSNVSITTKMQQETNNMDNITYVKDLFRNKVINAKSSSRRPLSSWKQSINACGPGPAPWIEKSTLHSLGIQGELINKSKPIDYTQYVKRYANSNECGNSLCKELSYREHFHCNALSCNSRVFMKKEEMIRHFKWHKKRDESLTHGFLRCSPGDNCIERFKNCPHHRKQTHYHCLKRGCDKVYISTSDVQMHANYHRKDTAIIQEGFQRFRATENCLLECCAFFGQKTTHFHCRRDNCNHTFKNKADMEKHKSYHIRDEQLARDGFKKFMKHETCTFDECRSSRVCNHIHCIRSGCTHVLHSTNHLQDHKCKHERCEKELAYRKYRLAQSIYKSNQFIDGGVGNNRLALNGINLDINLFNNNDSENNNDGGDYEDDQSFETLLFNFCGDDGDEQSALESLSEQLPLQQMSMITIEDIVGDISETRCSKYIQKHCQINDQCNFEYEPPKTVNKEHFNCINCNICWLDHSSALKHAWKHVLQEEIIPLMFDEINDLNICNNECLLFNQNVGHYHCRMLGCPFSISLEDKTLKILEHYKFHEDQQIMCPLDEYMATKSAVTLSNDPPAPTTSKSPSVSSTSSSKCSSTTKSFVPEGNTNNNNNDNIVPNKNSKPEETTSSSSLQVFPTGTTLISVDGMPILKRKRGRPPKNRSTDLLGSSKKNNNSSNQSTTSTTNVTTTTSLGSISSFDLAQAFNLPLNHAANIITNLSQSTGDLSKTIPIPLIMPYIKSSIHNGFYVFDEETLCPDVTCIYLGQKHFHCSKPRCYYSTNHDDILLEHSKDFHDNIDILEGFVYFDDNIDCKLPNCPYNKKHKHFHCTRTGCSYSFARYSLMASHDEKHLQEKVIKSDQKLSPLNQANSLDDLKHHFMGHDDENNPKLPPQSFKSSDLRKTKRLEIDANTDFINGSGGSHHNYQMKRNDDRSQFALNSSLQKILDYKMTSGNVEGSVASTEMLSSNPTPLTTNSINQLDELVKQHQAYDENNMCNSPFCKLKRRFHFHCSICNQAFTNYERLIPHCLKHINSMYSMNSNHHSEPVINESNERKDKIQNEEFLLNSTVNNIAANNSFNFTNEFFQMFLNNLANLPSTSTTTPPTNSPLSSVTVSQQLSEPNINPMMKTLDTSSSYQHDLSNKRRSSFSSDGSASNDYCINKKHKAQDEDSKETNNESNSCKSSQNVEDSSCPSPNGYSRFRFNEDCGFLSCVYREHQTHFHCMRKDCGYSFCDKTRFVQHTARHERLDTLMGGDFQQFRSSVSCGHMDCQFVNTNISMGNKTSHFHCLKCEYVCADTNKVVAHRRYHSKMDNISAAGFEKYAPNQDCFKELCNYKLKQTHYHCSTCNYSVLGLSQMSAHKQKHEQQQPNHHHPQQLIISPIPSPINEEE